MNHAAALSPRIGRKVACRAFALPARTERHRRRVNAQRQACETARATPATPTCRWCKTRETTSLVSVLRIPDEQREEIYAMLCSERFCELPADQVFWELLDEGTYYCSIRTMYRILAEHGANREPRRGRHTAAKSHVMPRLRATKQNQVWCWDVTLLPTMTKGKFYYLSCIIDLYSRKIVGWLLSHEESQDNAEALIDQTCERRGISRDQLTIHADRGAIQRADTVQKLMASRGDLPSYSRPRVSNDNAFIESFFKTLKYHHEYPLYFATLSEARAWVGYFLNWYNTQHHHRGLHDYTPQAVDDGTWQAIHMQRQAALDAAYAKYPERFHHAPLAKTPPSEVTLNIRSSTPSPPPTTNPCATEEVMPISA